jgi:hypothetical protein
MAKSKAQRQKTYTYAEILERYFPGDTIEVEDQIPTSISTIETINTDEFLDLFKRIMQPTGSTHQKVTSKK